MKIVVIFTGGTIGSRVSDGIISNTKDETYRLLDLYHEQDTGNVEFIVREPYNILSENLSIDNMKILIKTVRDALSKTDIDGVIVTHGTDTVQYSAAALQYVFAESEIPILLVSSAFVLDDARSNGFDNFCGAVDFIEKKAGKGVFVSYRNIGEKAIFFHRGTRMQNPFSYSSDMASILDSWYCKSVNGVFVINPEYKEGNAGVLADGFGEKNPRILRIQASPNMIYPENEADAVLIEAYHSGTVCVDTGFTEFVKNIGVPVYLTGLNGNEAEYETVEGYRKLGIITLNNRASIAQYIKLMIAVSNGMNIASVMDKEFADETAI